MNKLTKSQEKRFDLRIMGDWSGSPIYMPEDCWDEVKQHLADELSIERKRIMEHIIKKKE